LQSLGRAGLSRKQRHRDFLGPIESATQSGKAWSECPLLRGEGTMSAPGPLDGIRVLDLSSVVLGPMTAQYLGDMGADVIKVEAPEGDITRYIGPRRSEKMGALFLANNRNKRSIVLFSSKSNPRPLRLRMPGSRTRTSTGSFWLGSQLPQQRPHQKLCITRLALRA
jgi:hypothetical protein